MGRALRDTASMLFIQQAGKTAFIINGLMQGTVNFVNCWQSGLQKNSCAQSPDAVTAVTESTAYMQYAAGGPLSHICGDVAQNSLGEKFSSVLLPRLSVA